MARLPPLAEFPFQRESGHPVFEKPQHPPAIDFVEGNHGRLSTISTFPNA